LLLPLQQPSGFPYHRHTNVSTVANRRADTRASANSKGLISGLLDLVECFARVAECVDAGGNAAIDGDLKQDLLDLVLGKTVLQRP
jgi:hypothetical protein